MDLSERPDNKDFVWAVELNRYGLELMGLWPKTDDATNNFTSDLRVGVFLILLIFVCIIPLLCTLVRVWGDIIFMTENLQITLPLLVVLMKFCIIRWKKADLSSIMNMMAEDWMELKVDAERDAMVRRARTARLITIYTYVMMITIFLIVMVLPSLGIPISHSYNLTNQDRQLPLQLYYFYDTDNSPQYELTFAAQLITMFWCALVYLSIDALLVLMILHLCGQMENLGYRMTNLYFWKDFYSALRNNVDTHLRLMRFAGNIEDIFSLITLILFLYFSITFCLYVSFLLVEFTNGINDSSLSRICYAIAGISVILFNTFLYCGSGEIVEMQCEAVHRAICDLEWYRLESTKAKSLVLLMIRANESFHITAGKIFPLTMSTFCSLLKTTAGYTSFLLTKRS